MRAAGAGDDLACAIDDHAFGFEGADVDAKGVCHVLTRQDHVGGDGRKGGVEEGDKPLKIGGVNHLKRGMRIAHRKADIEAGDAFGADELDVGKVRELPALNSFFQGRGNSAEHTAALKKHLATLKPSDKVLYVSHQVNTTALTGVYPDSGEVVLFKFLPNGEVTVLGRVRADTL